MKQQKRMLHGFVVKLTENKKLELFVFAALLASIIIIFFVSHSISCEGGALTGDERTEERNSLYCSELEKRLESILSCIDGAGMVKVMITCNNDSEVDSGIRGVIVVAEGARDPRVKTELINAAATVLGTEADKVNVYLMRK